MDFTYENIRNNWISSAFSVDFPEPTSDFPKPIILSQEDKNKSLGIHSQLDREEHFGNKIVRIYWNFHFLISSSCGFIFGRQTLYAMSL